MSKHVFVSNLAFSVTESEVNDLFRQFGTIESCRLVTERNTGRSKGFAFVDMSTAEEASRAIAKLAEHQLGGRVLSVSEARPKTQSSRWVITPVTSPDAETGKRRARNWGGRSGNY